MISDYIDGFDKIVTNISKKEIFSNPDKLYGNFDEKLKLNEKLLINAYNNFINDKNNSLDLSVSRLNDLNPLNVLSRGYSLIYNNDKLVKKADDIKENDIIKIKMANDSIKIKASNIEKVK